MLSLFTNVLDIVHFLGGNITRLIDRVDRHYGNAIRVAPYIVLASDAIPIWANLRNGRRSLSTRKSCTRRSSNFRGDEYRDISWLLRCAGCCETKEIVRTAFPPRINSAYGRYISKVARYGETHAGRLIPDVSKLTGEYSVSRWWWRV